MFWKVIWKKLGTLCNLFMAVSLKLGIKMSTHPKLNRITQLGLNSEPSLKQLIVHCRVLFSQKENPHSPRISTFGFLHTITLLCLTVLSKKFDSLTTLPYLTLMSFVIFWFCAHSLDLVSKLNFWLVKNSVHLNSEPIRGLHLNWDHLWQHCYVHNTTSLPFLSWSFTY